jgi:hypothetical protein
MKKTDLYRKQHADLVKIVKEIEDLLLPGKLPAEAAKARETLNLLSGKISVHLTMEDNYLYPALLKHHDDAVRAKAQTFIDEMGHIKKTFFDYNQKWFLQAIKKNPDGFTQETKAVFAALDDRIKRENTDLYVLVDEAGITVLAAQ